MIAYSRKQSPLELAESVYRLEKLLGIAGGRQDQYAAVLGGFQLLCFGGEDEPAEATQLQVPIETVTELEERCIVCYSGPPPAAGSVHERVWERYQHGDETVASSLRSIRDSVAPACEAMLAGNLERLADMLTVNREAASRLYPGVVTPRMQELFRAGADAGAVGSKPCGAGGGGCLLFLCAADRRQCVESALCSGGGIIIDFVFAR